jgi:hypothetical protein
MVSVATCGWGPEEERSRLSAGRSAEAVVGEDDGVEGERVTWDGAEAGGGVGSEEMM